MDEMETTALPSVDDLQAEVDQMQAELGEQRAQNERLTAWAARLEEMLEAMELPPEEQPPLPEPPEEEPVDPPPVDPPEPQPPGPIQIDPMSKLPWRSGFGQCSRQLRQLEKMRGRPAGAVAGWTNYTQSAKDWAGLRGGPLGRRDAMEGVFARSGAMHFHDFVGMVDRRCLLIWVMPALPTSLNNEYLPPDKARKQKKKVGWQNPGIYRRLTDKDADRTTTISNWVDHGERLGHYIGLHGINPALFIEVLGWECTGNWYPWSVGPDVESFKAYWCLAVDSIRAGLRRSLPGGWEKVRFEYRLAGVTKFVDWDPLERSFPGNEHASILGCSIHGGLDSLGDPEGWRQEVMGHADGGKIGLEPARQLAVQNKCLLGADEWGIVSKAGDLHHPRDPNPYKGMGNVLQWFETNARDLSHECFLFSSKYNLLDRTWPGQAGYVQNLNAVAGKVRPVA